ncbi:MULTISPECIES: gas vesicle protein GvpG [unclassified Nonomuraea]|uniref:gas vesicle protein GvpG n=1 Tax=unclassified Nonomuraea TaxID=2593643 RepID=UPI00273CE658|nr:gas vesicle protein GvpG [Nonomuraea sp. G32]MDP4502069.1 gas vesicle protein GvpG [Nonomuraea sp. G32]
MISGLVTWPLAPAFAVIRMAEFLCDRAEEQLYDPVRIRRELEDVAADLAAGEISEEEAAAREEELLDRLLRAPRR